MTNAMSSVKKVYRSVDDAYQEHLNGWVQENSDICQRIQHGASAACSNVGQLFSYTSKLLGIARYASQINDQWYSKNSPLFQGLQKSRVVALGVLPFTLAKFGYHIHDAVTKRKKFRAVTNLTADIGSLLCTTSTAIAGLRLFGAVSLTVAQVGAYALGIGTLLSSVSIVVTAKRIYKRGKFQKSMNQAQNIGEFIQNCPKGKIIRHFGISDEAAVKRVVKDAFDSGDQVQQKKVTDALKGRLTQNNWSDKLSILVDSVAIVAFVALVLFPPLAPISYAVFTTVGLIMMTKAVYDYVEKKKLKETLGIEQKLKRSDGIYHGDVKNNQPHGIGLFTSKNGVNFSGKWINGQLDESAGCQLLERNIPKQDEGWVEATL